MVAQRRIKTKIGLIATDAVIGGYQNIHELLLIGSRAVGAIGVNVIAEHNHELTQGAVTELLDSDCGGCLSGLFNHIVSARHLVKRWQDKVLGGTTIFNPIGALLGYKLFIGVTDVVGVIPIVM